MNFDDYPPQADPNQTDGVDDTVIACSLTARSRIFWGLVGLSCVCTSLAIYGAWTGKISPYWNWPLWAIGTALIFWAPRFADNR
jgi:hypothetical protein